MDIQNSEQKRVQLNSRFQILVAILFFVVPFIILTQMITQLKAGNTDAYFNLLFLSFFIVMAYRMKDLKRVSYSPTQFYVRSLFRNDEISLPISCITSFEKAAFIILRDTDIFLIRYKDFDGLNKMIKIVRSRYDPSVITFKQLVEANKNEPTLRGIVENKF